MKDYKPKMRIQLLDTQGVVQSDRLVDQYTELNEGPHEQHVGPIRLEMVLHDAVTFDRAKAYLDKIRGLLPLEPKGKKAKLLKSKPKTDDVNAYQNIAEELKKKEFIEDIIDYLDEINFRFISHQLIEDMGIDLKIPKDPTEVSSMYDITKYQPMVRVLKYAKDPANDKFDTTMIVFIKFIGKPSERVIIMYNGKLKLRLKRPWKKSGAVNMKKKKIPMVFPDYMTIDERKRWRHVRRKVETQKPIGDKDQKFYDRYFTAIKDINEGKGFNL